MIKGGEARQINYSRFKFISISLELQQKSKKSVCFVM